MAKERKWEEIKEYSEQGNHEKNQENPNIIIGRNPVMELLKSGREVEKLLVLKDGEGSIKKILGMAKEQKLLIKPVERAVLDRAADGQAHQGVIAYISPYTYCQVEDILASALQKGEDPFVIILDGIEDPHNLGAIMRSADGAGAHGIIISKRRAVGLTYTVAKSSAGAIEYMPVARVSNISQTIEKLKKQGMWIGAVDMDGDVYWKANLTGPLGLVIGNEGQGIGRLVKESCDFTVSIPMKGKVSSLNASNAAAILMYEAARQKIFSEKK